MCNRNSLSNKLRMVFLFPNLGVQHLYGHQVDGMTLLIVAWLSSSRTKAVKVAGCWMKRKTQGMPNLKNMNLL